MIAELNNPYEYAPEVWRLFRAAPLSGDFAAGTPHVFVGEVGTPAARSVLRLSLRFEGGRVADARFRAYGCPASIAVGGWIATWAIGKTVPELTRLKAAALRAALELPDDRAHCALLGEDALRAAIARHQESAP